VSRVEGRAAKLWRRWECKLQAPTAAGLKPDLQQEAGANSSKARLFIRACRGVSPHAVQAPYHSEHLPSRLAIVAESLAHCRIPDAGLIGRSKFLP
jgi:hypothetical protein